MSEQEQDDFERKLDCVIEYFKTFRTHAEQQRNMLRYKKETSIPFSPSDQVELDHLEKLIELSNSVLPYASEVQQFRKDVLKNHKHHDRRGFQAPPCKNCNNPDPNYVSLGVSKGGTITLKCVHCGARSVKD